MPSAKKRPQSVNHSRVPLSGLPAAEATFASCETCDKPDTRWLIILRVGHLSHHRSPRSDHVAGGSNGLSILTVGQGRV